MKLQPCKAAVGGTREGMKRRFILIENQKRSPRGGELTAPNTGKEPERQHGHRGENGLHEQRPRGRKGSGRRRNSREARRAGAGASRGRHRLWTGEAEVREGSGPSQETTGGTHGSDLFLEEPSGMPEPAHTSPSRSALSTAFQPRSAGAGRQLEVIQDRSIYTTDMSAHALSREVAVKHRPAHPWKGRSGSGEGTDMWGGGEAGEFWPLEPGGWGGQALGPRKGCRHLVRERRPLPAPCPASPSQPRAPAGFLSQQHSLTLTTACSPPAFPVSRGKLAADPSSGQLCESVLPARTSCGPRLKPGVLLQAPVSIPTKSGNPRHPPSGWV